MAPKPLHDIARVRRVVVATYQSVSGAGKAAMDELFDQTRKICFQEEHAPAAFPRRIAFNAIPHIDRFADDGSTGEERKMMQETQKILDPEIVVSATYVRVPVFVGHAEAVNVEFDTPDYCANRRATHAPSDSLQEAEAAVPGCLYLQNRRIYGTPRPY